MGGVVSMKDSFVTEMSEYHEIGLNEYPNIFGCPTIDQTNIQIYLDVPYLIKQNNQKNWDAQELTKRISEYIWMPKN